MIKIPRSIAIRSPYRGRSIRSMVKSKLPGGRWVVDTCFKIKAEWIKIQGKRKLAAGMSEGRRFITNIPHPFCGIGHSFCEWNCAFEWAPRLGHEFAHIPLKDCWDQFFGISDLPTYQEVLCKYKPIIIRVPPVKWSRSADAFPNIQKFVDSVRSDRNLLFVLADGQNSYDHTTHVAKFRELFETKGNWQDLPRHTIEGKLNIAVHLRRGDVAQMASAKTGDWQERYVSEEWFVNVMEAVREAVEYRPVAYHIYSQGSPNDFPLVKGRPDCQFHLDAGEEETLLNMSRADLLIMSPSGFSYLAAMLSEGIKIARYPWWHYIPDSPGWIRVGKSECENLKLVVKEALSSYEF